MTLTPCTLRLAAGGYASLSRGDATCARGYLLRFSAVPRTLAMCGFMSHEVTFSVWIILTRAGSAAFIHLILCVAARSC